MTYKQWLSKIDQIVVRTTGLSVHDLADAPFRDYFDDGMDPAEAAFYIMEAGDVPEELLEGI